MTAGASSTAAEPSRPRKTIFALLSPPVGLRPPYAVSSAKPVPSINRSTQRQGGPFCAPIGGPDWTPFDILGDGPDFYLFGQSFHGYGENLLDYNKRATRLRIGVALVR